MTSLEPESKLTQTRKSQSAGQERFYGKAREDYCIGTSGELEKFHETGIWVNNQRLNPAKGLSMISAILPAVLGVLIAMIAFLASVSIAHIVVTIWIQISHRKRSRRRNSHTIDIERYCDAESSVLEKPQ